jgi:regulator of chromosome condensation (RCC1) repeat-containing protein
MPRWARTTLPGSSHLLGWGRGRCACLLAAPLALALPLVLGPPPGAAGAATGVATVAPLDGKISAGPGYSLHTCAVTAAGAAECWGSNQYGELGDGTTTASPTPVAVVGLASGVAAISAGMDHTCALTSAGAVKCWGANYHGQLGNGTTTASPTPVDVVGLGSGVVAISVGYSHSCALTSAGAVKCWGSNWAGQLGDGSQTDRLTPVDVVGLASGVTSISSGSWDTCAITSAGAAKCWGWNWAGQLGDGTYSTRLAPVGVAGLGSGMVAISPGNRPQLRADERGRGQVLGPKRCRRGR